MSSSHHRRSRETSHAEMPIGRYTRLDEIGRGSFATVYQGVHTKSRTYVAIKSVNLSKLNKKLKENLSSEIHILKGLYHPHIVALIDCHETTSHIHLVMEYCALGDLSLFIKRRDTLGDHRYTQDMIAKYPNPRGGALNEVVVRHFLKQLASALKFLRDRNLIHRDIKPQNLLLCPSPSSYRSGVAQVVPFKGCDESFSPATGLESLPMLKIADFGFARSLPSTSLAETLCGSPLYMAPEILRYEKYDAKADLWSVGTVLYEMVVGKPPFRATNHVELLRKIEKGEDRIKFPEENPASEQIKSLIRMLLKRNPVERMNFSDFFDCDTITGPIPGLIADDAPSTSRRSSVAVNTSGSTSRPQSRTGSRTPTGMKREKDASYPGKKDDQVSYPAAHRPPTQRSDTPPASSPMRRMGSGDRATTSKETVTTTPRRPSVVSLATAPGRQELVDRNATAAVMERQRSRNTYAGVPQTEKQAEKTKEESERAAQEIAFERDYVLVEKRAVEVNAFADELAHSPRIQGGFPRNAYALSRRPGTQGSSTATATSPLATTGKAMQVASGRARADSTHTRQGSYERRYGQSPTSAISKALHMASGRLFGMGFSPPMTITKGGRSPPLGYNPFPAYPAAQGSLMVVGDGARTNVTLDEDAKTVQVIEECATRSDVVYGFAEVKYKQLIPLAPSVQTDPSGRANVPGGERDSTDLTDGGLTVDAVVTLSEEALVLYVKALSLLAKSMDIAGAWWSRKNRGEAFGESAMGRTDATSTLVSNRINNVVQWVRNRFNEVLEKAEFVRLKLIEGQKRLPPDHPSHPSNHSVGPSVGSGASTDVVVSSGVTAEKLMYDRALEMSRAAAINELTGEELSGCEIAYVTAIRMLEAVLEEEEVSRSGPGSGTDRGDARRDGDKAMLDGVRMEDRQVVIKLVSSIRGRLASLRKKLALLAKRQSPPSSVPGKVAPSSLVPAAQAVGTTPK
ncbi:Serine/threonine-protein kinase [Aspergillus flavus]|uniref:Serine/threonine-protein kinase ATG1 n=2 Tax=Aspergillus subgen. Circumdati TaxID=2720871 RepID=A0AB74BY20_ASPFL|nr:serine/threonine-protein kinase involved in autophagy [Aspergillus oryzae 3.042]KDE82815.1 serine/threonine-protein [Aspergillus oryzae 100-8]RMZ39079.1 serine/threonine protein kinase (Pdd7p) [Aspergillus flavus]UDD58637.1 Serine/threonine-protein kinase [Aspergillus flavus]|eukprot:EIT75267.1 serine/threonine-protein kinase involved in autophagy [Aspergillus oryzae 3.042]